MDSLSISPLLISFQVAIIATAIVLVLATLVAYFMHTHTFRFKGLLEYIFLLPIVLPPSVVGFLILVIVGNSSPLAPFFSFLFGGQIIFTKKASVIAACIVAFPIMYQAARISFNNIDQEIIEAAMLDQANSFNIFRYIIVPVSANGILTGAILSFARAFGEFGATLMVAGNIPGETQSLSIAIYMAMASNDITLAMIYVIIMIIASILFLSLTKYLAKK